MPDPAWPFHEVPNLAVLTVRQITEQGAAILHVSHDADDGGWQFLTGTSPSEDDARVVALRRIRRLDPTVDELVDLPLGWVAWREAREAPWRRKRSAT